MPLENGTNLLTVEAHPLLDLGAFVTEFPAPLGELSTGTEIESLFSLDAAAPLKSGDAMRRAVRDLLRRGGFKPTGRNKPASEYLIRAVGDGALSSINLAVDACNAVSLHSGLPISVVDLDKASGSLRVAVAAAGETYVFNPAGQTIDVGGLICLHDAAGPCANAVKDAQRTKTGGTTRRTLTLIWGTNELEGRTAATERWYRDLLERQGARTRSARPRPMTNE